MQFKPSIVVSCALLTIALAIAIAPVIGAKDEKLKPEQVIAKHLESIGPEAKIKEMKTRVIAGTVHVDIHVGGQANVIGQGTILSEGDSIRAGFNFPSLGYPGEQFSFDGEQTTGVAQVQPGRRSPLGQFIFENDVLLKEGLLFGELSTSWALLDTAGRQPKLDVTGLKKIDGRSLYEVKYEARKGRGNVQAWLYFDPDSFHHVRSQYKVEFSSTQVKKIGDSAEPERYTLIEEFDQFKAVDGLTLPHSYKLDFAIDSPRGAFVATWTYAITGISHNQPIDRQLFSVK
jgi:hypothetical protein